MDTIQISDKDFEEKVLKSSKPVLVDCFAVWCGPCKAMGPIIDELNKEYGSSYDIYKLDVDQNPETAQKYGIMSIPTLLLFKGGELKETLIGLQEKDVLVSRLTAF